MGGRRCGVRQARRPELGRAGPGTGPRPLRLSEGRRRGRARTCEPGAPRPGSPAALRPPGVGDKGRDLHAGPPGGARAWPPECPGEEAAPGSQWPRGGFFLDSRAGTRALRGGRWRREPPRRKGSGASLRARRPPSGRTCPKPRGPPPPRRTLPRHVSAARLAAPCARARGRGRERAGAAAGGREQAAARDSALNPCPQPAPAGSRLKAQAPLFKPGTWVPPPLKKAAT